MDSITEVEEYVKKNLHGVARAITTNANISLVAAVVVKPEQNQILLWEDIYRNYVIPFSSAKEENGQLHILGDVDTWVLRPLTPEQEERFKRSMKLAGFNA